MRTPLNALAGQIAIQIGKVFCLDDIVEAHRCMEENMAGEKDRGVGRTTCA
jgi:hypothetical protein